MRWPVLPAAGLLLAAVGLLAVWARRAPAPGNLGLHDGRLSPCPGSPNCVSSEEGADAGHAMPPWTFAGDPGEAMAVLAGLVGAAARARVVDTAAGYLHAEFRTPVIGFIDDVEFRFDPASGSVRFRSASRLGYSDLGVNRRRMDALGRRFLRSRSAGED